MKNPEKVVEHIVEWLKSYALESNMNGFVVGVSGGIDSAVTSTLCALSGRQSLPWKCQSIKVLIKSIGQKNIWSG